MSEIVIALPADLATAVAGDAARHGVSEVAWIEDALRMKLASQTELAYLANRAAKADLVAYERALARVPATTPLVGDERS